MPHAEGGRAAALPAVSFAVCGASPGVDAWEPSGRVAPASAPDRAPSSSLSPSARGRTPWPHGPPYAAWAWAGSSGAQDRNRQPPK
eukprot:scaffold94211_cov63-Phaeocystis_antarctica.AAC.2